MNNIYTDLRESLYKTVEKALSDIGIKNFRLAYFSSGATYPTPEVINFKILIGDSNSSAYLSINTITNAKYNNAHFEFSIKISANITEDYTINYVNGGSHNTNKQLDTIIEQKLYELGEVSTIDIRDYGANWNGWNWRGTDVKAEANYTEKTGNTLYSVRNNHINNLDAKTIINKVSSVVNNYIIENKKIILSKLNTDTIYDHLDKFEKLFPSDFENIKEGDDPIYYRYGNSEFKLMKKDDLENIRYDVPYGTIMGYRRYFRFNDAIYIWFGDDQTCSLWC